LEQTLSTSHLTPPHLPRPHPKKIRSPKCTPHLELSRRAQSPVLKKWSGVDDIFFKN
jgi:hypothetical protein